MTECEFIDKVLLIERYSGKVSLFDILELKKYEFEHKLYSNKLKVLVELGDTQFEDNTDFTQLETFILQNIDKIKRQKIAIVSSVPRHVALSYLLQKSLEGKNIDINICVFSTKKAACGWLGISNKFNKEE